MTIYNTDRATAALAFVRSDADWKVLDYIVTPDQPGDTVKMTVEHIDGDRHTVHLMVYTRGELIDQLEVYLNEGDEGTGFGYLNADREREVAKTIEDVQALTDDELAQIVRDFDINDFVPAGCAFVQRVGGENLFVSYI